MKLIPKKSDYNWKYCSVGGVVRVRIESGEDIAHLHELDKKMWTVLSCPVKDLEFDRKTLGFIDSDGDGTIRVDEVIAASKWLSAAVKDKDSILKGLDHISLKEFNESTEEGKALKAATEVVLKNLKKKGEEITLAEVSDYAACQAEKEIDKDAVFPYGDSTEAALAAYENLTAKVADYFTRCKMLAYDADIAAKTTVSVDKIEDIAVCPIAQPRESAILPFDGINPAWQGAFAAVKSLILDAEFKKAKGVTEEQWASIAPKFAAFKAWKAEAGKFSDDAGASKVDKFLHLYRDFYKFLGNYVIFEDFYTPDQNQKAMFEAGWLFIDQRCCKLCVKVADMAAHSDMAGLSGMFLLYCTCTSRVKNASMNIVAVLTAGGTNGLRPGKNAVFYDRDGEAWDAVVTKIVDNPISIKQAFFSPYVKFWDYCVGLINKSAADKENKVMADLQAKANDVSKDPNAAKEAPKAFDIAKFAGIFAAIGMAIGYLSSALTKIVGGIANMPIWQTLAVIVGIMICISGPSCFIAWTKLRKRNLGPVLNANGWAINSVVLVNILFGATLTSTAKYPHLNLSDPYKPETPAWKKVLTAVIVLLVVIGGILLWLHKDVLFG